MEKEEIKKMKKLEKLEKRVIYPDVQFYGAYIHTGEDIYLCDDIEEDEDTKVRIECYIKDNVLYTNIERNYKTIKGRVVNEEIHQSISIDKNEVLVYVQGSGFVVPEYNMIKISDAIELYKILENGGNEEDESIGNAKESIEIDRRD